MILEVCAIKDVFHPSFEGCGAYDWCVAHNAFYKAFKKEMHYFVNVEDELKHWYYDDNTENDLISFFDNKEHKKFYFYESILDCLKHENNIWGYSEDFQIIKKYKIRK